MRARQPTRLGLAAGACVLGAACGRGRTAAGASAERLLDWPEFGLDPQRSDVSERATGITSANVAHLRHVTVSLPGTVDSSPIYLHGVSVGGTVHDVIVVTTTYGKTMAIEANSGQILWWIPPEGLRA